MRAWIAPVLLAMAACHSEAPPTETTAEALSPAVRINEIADRYYEWRLATMPETAYFAAIELERHDGIYDNSLVALQKEHAFVDGLLAEVEGDVFEVVEDLKRGEQVAPTSNRSGVSLRVEAEQARAKVEPEHHHDVVPHCPQKWLCTYCTISFKQLNIA